MNKEEFIKQLKQNICILDDQEQQYFVEEYTQHIEMKIRQGMSEEEAVREIGSVEELSKEILESYHVKTDQAKSGFAKRMDYGKFFGKIKSQTDKIYERLASCCNKIASKIKGLLAKRKKEKEAGESEGAGGGGWLRRLFRALRATLRFCGKVIRSCLYLALWCLTALWNLFMVCCGLLGILMLVVCVFFLGVSLIMLMQGYPFAGLTVSMLGLAIALGALTVCCFCFIKRRWYVGKRLEGGEADA